MSYLPHNASRLPQFLGLIFLAGTVPPAHAEPSLQDIAPTQTRLLLAQNAPAGSGAAVSSEAATTMPKIPGRLQVPKVEAKPAPVPTPEAAPPSSPAPIDPLLDPRRPRNSQLTIESEQSFACGDVAVTLPAGVYKQILIMENPEGRRASDTTELRRQQVGWGYIRYLSDAEITVGSQKRTGGLDVGVRPEDNLPVRVWYKKMTQPDDVTKALTFILPPIGLVAGAGGWSSGNTLLPDSPLQFTEARDYFLREPSQEDPPAHPAFRTRPADPKTSPGFRANR